MSDLNSPRNLDELFKRQPKSSPVYKPYSPSSAVKYINTELTKREYASFTNLELLGLEDKLDSKINWLTQLARPIPPEDIRALESIRLELRQSSRQANLNYDDRPKWIERNKWLSLYPDEGPHRRELYTKHMDVYRMTATHNEVLALGSNRSGKSYMGAYMTVCHTTGIYPTWWEGRRFTEPIVAWIANKGAKDVRDINEKVLLGPPEDLNKRGTGMLPAHRIIKCTPKTGIPNGTEFIDVAHVSGGVSRIQSKSFDQGREAFQGTSIPFIWLDEECPDDVYGECLLRTMDCSGLVVLTYTPIQGLTPLTTEFMNAAGIQIDDHLTTSQEPVNG